MTLLFQRAVPGPATHAFVIGVGGYPDAKPGKGGDPNLRNVKDIPSAANSANLVIDWLLDNKDSLAAPLASLEALIGEAQVQAPARTYGRTNFPGVPVDEPTLANVNTAGDDWVKRATVRAGDTALFYICGHGARKGDQPVVFLTDLNRNQNDRWGAHVNLKMVADAFKVQPVKVAFFLADACQEFIPRFELAVTQGGALFIAPLSPFDLDKARDKVWLLSAASDAQLAYEGDWIVDNAVKVGRFTETLLAALDGASVRYVGGRWIVYPSGVSDDIKALHRVRRQDWSDRAFEPSQALSPNEPFPIVSAAAPSVTVSILTDPPDVMDQYEISVLNSTNQSLGGRVRGSSQPCTLRVPASLAQHVAIAIAQNPGTVHREIFVPIASIFDQRIRIP